MNVAIQILQIPSFKEENVHVSCACMHACIIVLVPYYSCVGTEYLPVLRENSPLQLFGENELLCGDIK